MVSVGLLLLREATLAALSACRLWATLWPCIWGAQRLGDLPKHMAVQRILAFQMGLECKSRSSGLDQMIWWYSLYGNTTLSPSHQSHFVGVTHPGGCI
jgi:hypothetical protein